MCNNRLQNTIPLHKSVPEQTYVPTTQLILQPIIKAISFNQDVNHVRSNAILNQTILYIKACHNNVPSEYIQGNCHGGFFKKNSNSNRVFTHY